MTVKVQCSLHLQVADTEATLTAWASGVTKLRSQYQWLLFFSVPKQLLLYQLIQQCEEEEEEGEGQGEGQGEQCVDLLVREVMFLVSNDTATRKYLRADFQVKITMQLPYQHIHINIVYTCRYNISMANSVHHV